MMDLRRTGRTTRLLESLPESGGIFVVHSVVMQDYAVGLILHMRADGGAQHVKVVVIGTEYDADVHLRGACLPVVIDHAFYEKSTIYLVGYVKALAGAANKRANFRGAE